jgi:hypothetical protein
MNRNRIYVSWNEVWDLLAYVEQYLKERGLRDTAATRLKVRECIDRYTADGPLRKADVDFYLDHNIKGQLPLEEPTKK